MAHGDCVREFSMLVLAKNIYHKDISLNIKQNYFPFRGLQHYPSLMESERGRDA